MTEASPLLHRRRRPRDTTSLSLDSQHESSSPTEPSPTCLVPFLIGDRLFHVSTLSLQQDPSSRLAHMAAIHVQLRILLAATTREGTQHDGGHGDHHDELSVPDTFCVHDTVLVRLPPKRRMRTSPTDCTNPLFAVFVDRDPDHFRRLLMLLQGYHTAVNADEYAQYAEEAQWYGLQASWQRRFPQRTVAYGFTGCGSSCGGLRLSSSVIVSPLTDHFFEVNVSTPREARPVTSVVDAAVDRHERSVSLVVEKVGSILGIGVISSRATNLSRDVRRVPGCVMYYATGEVAGLRFLPQLHAAPDARRREGDERDEDMAIPLEVDLATQSTASVTANSNSSVRVADGSGTLSVSQQFSTFANCMITESCQPYAQGAVITVRANLVMGTVTWDRGGECVGVMATLFPNAAPPSSDCEANLMRVSEGLRFAVVMGGDSAVQLLMEDGAPCRIRQREVTRYDI